MVRTDQQDIGMKNTLENRIKFFAQYWGQHVGFQKEILTYVGTNSYIGDGIDFLELTPLSQITDDDAIECARLFNPSDIFENPQVGFQPYIEEWYEDAREYHFVDYNTIFFGDKKETVRFEICKDGYFTVRYFREKGSESINISHKAIKVADYLRSKGYALDWNGITVEEMIEWGWVKLKNSKNAK